jgi:hypothetical protein
MKEEVRGAERGEVVGWRDVTRRFRRGLLLCSLSSCRAASAVLVSERR